MSPINEEKKKGGFLEGIRKRLPKGPKGFVGGSMGKGAPKTKKKTSKRKTTRKRRVA